MTDTFADLKSEYDNLWATMKVRPERAGTVDVIARNLIAHKARYQDVERSTGVPWFVIAAWHNRESDADFDTQIAQGDPLDSVSVNDPSGRGPFDTWEDGAHDALVTLKHLDQVRDWAPARICYETERYNGFGYRDHHPEVKSPYLWSFTTHYTAGKYVSDGKFSASAVDKQCGAIPIMKRLMDMSGTKADAPVVKESLNTGGGWLAALVSALIAMFRGRAAKPAEVPVTTVPASSAPWMPVAIKEIGFHEIGENHGIEKYIIGGKTGGTDGEFWCADFANYCFETAGVPGTRSAMARSFSHHPNFIKLAGPAYGAVVVMWRGSPTGTSGHVYFYKAETKNGIVGLGGNQKDSVCEQLQPRARVLGFFWPKSVPLPKIGPINIDSDASEGSES